MQLRHDCWLILNIRPRIYSTSGLVEVIFVEWPCASLHKFVLQLLCLGSQLLQLLLLLLNLFVR